MSALPVVQPDARFIRDVMRNGGGDLKKCFQCATCSVACTLSPEDAPFPRKQMIQAQWGLKEQVLSDPAIWLCHNCGDCSKLCPRGAHPGEVFGALRQQAIAHFAFPGFLGGLVNNPRLFWLLLLIPVIMFSGLYMIGPRGVITENRPLEFADAFPLHVLEPFFFAVAGLVMIAFIVGTARLLKQLRARGYEGGLIGGLLPVLKEVMTHERFSRCGAEKGRFRGHLLTMWGFAGLTVMGTVVGIGSMTGLMHTPLDQTNPWKVFANICAVIILVGGTMLLVERLRDPAKRASTTYFDWFFLLTLYGVILTGILSQFLRLAQAASFMYPVYFVHLVLILALFLYAPYSKFAHFLYRTVVLAVVSNSSVRQPAGTNNPQVSDSRIPTASA